ncbi:MAG: pantoate--beta-alanine ligase [Verrucomicrobiales bacterium]
MKTIPSIADLRAELAAAPRPVVLVPTMGALHDGHAALIAEARRLASGGGTVCVTIFVNPTQFGPNEDFDAYPRTLDADAAICAREGADLIFAPNAAEMYAPDASVAVDESLLSRHLCGARRPGHFAGVCLVVLKLFNIAGADIAVFGKKDYQQLAIIRRMVRDLNVPIEIAGCETVREPDGLALSSRNRYLTAAAARPCSRPPARRCSPAAIRSARANATPPRSATPSARGSPGTRRSAGSIISRSPTPRRSSRWTRSAPPAQALPAVFFGKARLIDNVEVEA